MSYYQNGQPYYSPHSQPAQNYDGSRNNQGAYLNPSSQQRSSFEAGDDARGVQQQEEEARAGSAYNQFSTGPSTGQYGARPQPMTIQTSMPYRPPSQSVPSSGYQHQYPPATPSHSTYNPAQYHQQSSYNPQSYGAPQSAFQSSPAYQPYVPAAYQDSNLNRQPSMYNQNSYYSQTPQTAFPNTQAPAPPPRGADHPSQHSSSYGGYQHGSSVQYQSQYQTSSSDPNRQTSYSQAAPPTPAHDASTAIRQSSHSGSTPQHSYSSLSAQPSPDIMRNSSQVSRISAQSGSYASSSQFSAPIPPSRQPSDRSPQRSNTLDRHPQGRSLPGVPSESESDNEYSAAHTGRRSQGQQGLEDLMHQIDSTIGNPSARNNFDDQSRGTSSGNSPQPLLSPDEAPTHLNGNIASTGEAYVNYGAFEDDSDAEAAAGLAAMQALDDQEAAEDSRRRSGSATLFPSQSRQSGTNFSQQHIQDISSDSDYAGYDLSVAGGGYGGYMHYGDDGSASNYASAAAIQRSESYNRLDPGRMNSVRSSGVSSEGRESATSGFDSIPGDDAIHPFPASIRNIARVDTGGTGGLTEPSPHPRRLSYEDGDEAAHYDWEDQTPDSHSPSKDDLPDMFFHPGMSATRPLPPPPSNSDPGGRLPLIPAGTYTQQTRFSQYTENRSSYYPTTPDTYGGTLLSPSPVPRSTSLTSQRTQSRETQPIRSKTDAELKAKMLRQQSAGRTLSDIYDPSEPGSAVALDLPTIPRKRFNPAKISSEQFKNCTEPWAMSSVLSWIRDLAEEETDLREATVAEGIVALFTNKVPTMQTTEAEVLGERVVQAMVKASALVKEEEWVRFGTGSMSGVIYQLTGAGCYSSKVHLSEIRGRCYAHHCMRTLKTIDTSSLPAEKKPQDWVTYYDLKKEDLDGRDRKDIERQNVLHEVVTTEEGYIASLDVVRLIYRDQLQSATPPVLSDKKKNSFIKEVFGLVDRVKKINQDYLLGRLKYRQNEQGPWIVGFSDIFREWIRRARSVYVEYATNYPRADFLIRREAERNLQFRQFLDIAQQDARSGRLGWDNFLKSPITRLQRYSLLLATVHKNMVKDSEEKMNLAFALDEVRAATHECDTKFAEMEKKMKLHEYAAKLKLRPGMERDTELNLDHLGREIIMSGDLLRTGGKGFQWVDVHAVLFDHYLVLSKTVVRGGRIEYYDVSKQPVPMDLIILESGNDPAVVKSTMKGLGAMTTTVAPRGHAASDPRLNRTTSTASGGSGGVQLQHTNTSTTIGSGASNPSMVASTNLEATGAKDDKVLYPFRVKHLGQRDTYTLYAPNAQNRADWCEAILQAKTRHAEELHAQNSEPFKLQVLADTAFGYEGLSYPSKRIQIRGTPLDRAVKESEKKYDGQGRPAPVCKAAVNCATVFNQPYGRLMCAIGTDYGVYVSEYQNSRGWVRAIQMQRVTQVAVLEEFNLFLLISDKVLIAYHLDVVCPPTGTTVPHGDASSRKAPQKLSGSKDVGFFVTGRMKDRALVFYKKRDGTNSIFKILEPVLQKSSVSRSRFLPSSSRRGQTEFFREYDEFYIPTDSYGLNLFHSTVAISTSRGVEVLTLDKKQAWSVPMLRSEQPDTQAHLSSIASRIKDLKPLGMFRLSEAEFLVTFEECAVYVNKHGDVSRSVVMEFVGRAKSACLHGQYLLLFDDDFVEIRDAQNGRLKQVIAGKDIRMLDDGGGGTGAAQPNSGPQAQLGAGANGLGMQGYGAAPRTVKMCVQHPEYERSMLVVELLLNQDKA